MQCGQCTFFNEIGSFNCSMCGLPLNSNSEMQNSHSSLKRSRSEFDSENTTTSTSTIPCPTCTFLNSENALKCSVCGTKMKESIENNNSSSETPSSQQLQMNEYKQKQRKGFQQSKQQQQNQNQGLFSEKQEQTEITNMNEEREHQENGNHCPICDCEFSDEFVASEHMNLHAENSDEAMFKRLQERFGFIESNGSRDYFSQFELSIKRDKQARKMNDAKQQEQTNMMENIRKTGLDLNGHSGFINSIAAQYLKARVNAKYLSGETDFYGSDRGDKGWGCGYRNIQMVSSFLFNYQEFASRMFSCDAKMPSVPTIQTYIEQAWAKGFDTQGANQLGNSVTNSKKYIGTTEAAALFRSFGIRAQVFDFYSEKKTEEEYKREIQLQTPSQKAKKKWISKWKPNKLLIEWVVNYYRTRGNSSFVPPLYLQHQGHSRTIVGAELRGNVWSLLIFDPSAERESLRQALDRKQIWRFKRTPDTFSHEKYQILMVEKGTMEESEEEKSKIIQSVVIGEKPNSRR